MDKTKFFKKFLRAKRLIKKILENEALSFNEKLELKQILKSFWDRDFSYEEEEYIQKKYGSSENKLNDIINS